MSAIPEPADALWRRICEWLVYPLFMTTGLVSLQMAMARGYDPLLALAAINTAVTIAVIGFEQLTPHLRSWNRLHGDLVTDIIHGLMTLIAVPLALEAALMAGMHLAATGLTDALGYSLWPSDWPVSAQLVLALVLAEFGQYWLHRALHEVPVLWRWHAVHHSAPRLYWLNGARAHPLEVAANYMVGVVVLVLLGVPEVPLTLYLLFAGTNTAFQHSNVRMRIGWLSRLCSQAELHRWHHSQDVAEANANYGIVLSVWDVVFGTWFLPRDRPPPEKPGIGDMPDFPRGYLGQFLAPFRWRRLRRDP